MDIESLTSEIGFTDEELRILLANLDQLTTDEVAEVSKMVDELKARDDRRGRQNDLIAFCVHMMPTYLVGRHHRRLANLLMDIEAGRKDRICVSVPPRHGKSQMASIFYTAWYLGKNPGHKVMLVSHTTDLAVDFGRKVRNIISSPEFKEVFPDVDLAADSKSAGRWSTNFGGEFFACMTPDTLISTLRGEVPAGEVTLEDRVMSGGSDHAVHAIFNTAHTETIRVAGGAFSAGHYVWTENRGWVLATEIKPVDVLRVESFTDTLKASIARMYNGYLEHPAVQALVQHKIKVRKPKKREVSFVRRPWDTFMYGVAGLQRLLSGHGGPAYTSAYDRPQGQRRSLQQVELPMGYASPTSEQQTNERNHRRQDVGRTCTGIELDARNVAVSYSVRLADVGSTEPEEAPAGELQNPRDTTLLRWVRGGAVRYLTRGSGVAKYSEPKKRVEKCMARVHRGAENVLRVLLGVRSAGTVTRDSHEPRPFVNFRVGGDNTLMSGGILTHNCGVGSALAGRGAHLLIVDDPHSEQDILNGNFEVFAKAYEWFAFGARTRLMPGGRIAIIHTRWHLDDLVGRVTRDMVKNPEADQYEVFEFPAILETDVVTPEGTTETKESPLWPEFFDLTALHRTKASMPLFQWSAQFQQNPTSEEAAIVKRDWWRVWTGKEPPQCEFLISSLDSAAEKHNRADYTSLTTWGVFFNDETSQHELILLNAVKDRFEFPELKAMCLEHYNTWEPDAFIVEKKSSGTAVYQELRRMGIAVSEYTPHRGSGDKYARLNAVADMISSGLVWVPETRWADDLVDEIASFPYGSNDDQVDSSVMALTRFRQGGFIRLSSDLKDDPPTYQGQREYY